MKPFNHDEPFGLPRGSVRAFLTTLLVGITAAVLFTPIQTGNDDVKAMFVLLTGIAVRDYFSSRERQAERSDGATSLDPSRIDGGSAPSTLG